MIHYYIIWLQLLNCHVIQLIFSYFVIIYFSFFWKSNISSAHTVHCHKYYAEQICVHVMPFYSRSTSLLLTVILFGNFCPFCYTCQRSEYHRQRMDIQ